MGIKYQDDDGSDECNKKIFMLTSFKPECL